MNTHIQTQNPWNFRYTILFIFHSLGIIGILAIATLLLLVHPLWHYYLPKAISATISKCKHLLQQQGCILSLSLSLRTIQFNWIGCNQQNPCAVVILFIWVISLKESFLGGWNTQTHTHTHETHKKRIRVSENCLWIKDHFKFKFFISLFCSLQFWFQKFHIQFMRNWVFNFENFKLMKIFRTFLYIETFKEKIQRIHFTRISSYWIGVTFSF